MNIQSFSLRIAEFNIQINCAHTNFTIWLDDTYKPFLVSDIKDITTAINVHHSIPVLYRNIEQTFTAKIPIDPFTDYDWSISLVDGLYIISLFSSSNKVSPFAVAVFEEGIKNVELYFANSDNSINPMRYPIGVLLLYYIAIFNGAILLHSSGITLHSHGILFSGVSGIGKSTMAKLWEQCGAQVINDDRLIIRKIDKDWYMFNSPMLYPLIPSKAILTNIFLLKQSFNNTTSQFYGAQAISKLFAFCIQHPFQEKLINNHLNTIASICEDIPVGELSFVPNTLVVDFVLNHLTNDRPESITNNR